MSKFIRLVNQGIQDFFISDGEDLGNGCDQFKNGLPYSLAYGQFETVLPRPSEEFTDSLVVHESLHGREDVVLERHEGRTCNLCREVGRLAFPQSEQSLAFLEDDLLGPAPGVNPVCLEESQREVSREQPAPWAALAAANAEEPDMRVCKDDVGTHVPALELAAVLLLASLVLLLDNGRSREILVLETVLGLALLADLYHSDVVALDVTGADELDNLATCEPAVSQHIAEAYLMLDSPADHLYGEVYLVHRILVKAGLDGRVLIPLYAVSSGKFLLAHPIVALPALLAKDAEVEQHLADAVSNAEKEGLEAEDAAVLKMGVDTADILHAATRLGEVRVINHQARVVRLMVTANEDLRPKLADEVVHQLAPVGTAIVEELIEHIFTTTKLAA